MKCRQTMKTLQVLVMVACVSLPISNISVSGNLQTTGPSFSPGMVIAVACSDPYPTLGEPVALVLTLEGNAADRFNESVDVTDAFQGTTAVDDAVVQVSGNVTISKSTVTIGRLPAYRESITWYPSVVGSHRFQIQAGASSEYDFNMNVSFDVQGIIAPSFGCPSIIRKDAMQDLSVTIAENRNISDAPTQLQKVELEAVDGSARYPLDDQTSLQSTQIATSADRVQDELTAGYSIISIPYGFYNLSVTTTKGTYTWPHAVKIMKSDPTNFSILQFTDIHIGKYADPVNKKRELLHLIAYANEHLHPDFLIISGDSVDWYNVRCRRNVLLDLRETLLTSTVPVFIVPGNHERYGNPLGLLYYPFTNLTPYHRFLNPLNDYSFHYGSMNFVFLDSGYDYSRWEITRLWNTTPEATGLTNTQMYLLETVWGDKGLHQIITMHHPVVYDKNDSGPGAVPNNLTSGNDQCIAFNRGAFISYCISHNVSLVLAGHTHESHVFNSEGKVEPENSTAWPLFIQTRSSTLSEKENGGRVIELVNGAVESCNYLAFP